MRWYHVKVAVVVALATGYGSGCSSNATSALPNDAGDKPDALSPDGGADSGVADGGNPTDASPSSDAGADFCADKIDGTPCGDASISECDRADTCMSGVCEPNPEAAGTTCGDPTDNTCTAPDSCDGFGNCIANHASAGTPCGDSSDTECTNPDSCNGLGSCVANHEVMGFACGDSSDTECTNPDSCDGLGSCVANHEAMGFACGDSSDTDCSNPDTCDGSGGCTSNHETDGTTCDDCLAGAGSCSTCSAGVCRDAPTCSSPTDLTTEFTGPGNSDGAMFDIVALSLPVNIKSFDVNLTAGTHDVEIWYRVGSYQGFTETPLGWIHIETKTGLVSNGPGVATPVPIVVDVLIPAGETYGFYITTAGSTGMNYSGGTDEGAVFVSDANIQILEGVGKQWPFSATFSPRVVNAIVHYQTCP